MIAKASRQRIFRNNAAADLIRYQNHLRLRARCRIHQFPAFAFNITIFRQHDVTQPKRQAIHHNGVVLSIFRCNARCHFERIFPGNDGGIALGSVHVDALTHLVVKCLRCGNKSQARSRSF